MSEEDFELRSIAWSKSFPFVRLFRTFKLAIDMRQLTLALACVVICYLGGRVLDRVWCAADAGVLKTPEGPVQTEIEAYATRNTRQFENWKLQTERSHRRADLRAVMACTAVSGADEAESQLATQPAQRLLETEDHQRDVAEVRTLIDDRLASRLDAVDADQNATSSDKQQQREDLLRKADYLRLVLAGCEDSGLISPSEQAVAVEAFADPGSPDEQTWIRSVVDRQRALSEIEKRQAEGPFAALLDYQMHCFAAAIQGVCTGRWGFSAGALDVEPAMLGSVASAGKGVLWLITQRPWYAIIYGIILLVVFSFFGGAICRSVAVRLAREESVELRAALSFAGQKFSGLLLAPLVPAGIVVVGAVLMFLGGLVGAIPVVGELLTGVLYIVALLGAFGLALIVLGTVLGFNLLWPTIGAEGSDAFDAVQHALGYIGQRPWYAGFYGFVLLLYGGACFVMLRLIALLLFKVTHAVSGAGMSLFGAWSSSGTDTIGKLDAMWHMPDWGELSLLPTTGGTPLWGTFGNAPLSGSETVAAVLIACWVFLLVALLGAFLVSFYFSGSTQMYFLLRYHVDAVDWDEVYYEEEESREEAPGMEPPAPAEPEGPQTPAPPDDAEAPESGPQS
jgi:hypothetical protein